MRLQRALKPFALVTAAIAATVAIAPSAFAQADSNITNTTTPFHSVIGSGCIGELIDVDGRIHVMSRTTTNENGDTFTSFHINLEASGTGQTTGTDYQFAQTTHEAFNHANETPLEFNSVDYVRITSHGETARDFRVRTQVHVTIDANGDLTASLFETEVLCD